MLLYLYLYMNEVFHIGNVVVYTQLHVLFFVIFNAAVFG